MSSGFWIGRKIFEDVLLEQFLDFTVVSVVSGNDGFRVFLHQFRAGSKHPHPDQIKAGAGDETRENAAGARFVKRIRRDDDISKLFRHKLTRSGRGGWWSG